MSGQTSLDGDCLPRLPRGVQGRRESAAGLGIELDGDLSFEGWTFTDRLIRRFLADAFRQGALVARWTVLQVDGGRCYMPDPDRFGMDTVESIVEGHDEGIAWTAKASEVALARLLNDIVGRPEPYQMERYMKQAGVIEVPDE